MKTRAGIAQALRGLRAPLLTALCLALIPQAWAVDLEAQFNFNIPPQKLTTALVELSRQIETQVVSDTKSVGGLSSGGLSGRMALKDALRTLLAGTSLDYRITESGVIAVGTFDSAAARPEPVDATPDSSRSSGSTLEEILVEGVRAEGTKGGAPLLEVPQAVTILSRDLMDAQGVQRLEQAVRYSAGISSSAIVDTRTEYISIRGFEQTRVGNYLDNLRLSFNSGGYSDWNIETYSLERVEILRGPSSVLYGQGSPGGVINSVSKRPQDSPHRELLLGAGNHGRTQAAFDLGGPADDAGRWLYRVIGVVRDGGTQVRLVDDNRLYIAPSATFNLSERTRFTLLTEYLQDRTGATIGFLPWSGTILANPNGRIRSNFFIGERSFDDFNTDRYSAGYQFEHRGSRWTFRQNARFGHQTLDYKALYGAGFEADLRTLARGSIASDETVDSLTLDNQAQTDLTLGSVTHSVLFGADYQWAKFDVRSGFGSAPSIDAFAPVYGQTVIGPELGSGIDALQRLRQTGIYVQDQMKFGSRWVATAGLRGDWPTASTNFRSEDFRVKQKDDSLTGRAGLVYLSESGFSPYLSYATSFLPTPGADFDGNPFVPETAKQYEIGVKFQPPGGRSFTTLSVFDLRRKKFLTADTDPDHLAVNPFAQVQQGGMRSRGVELEAKLNPVDGLDLVAAYTYLDARITDANVGDGNFYGNAGDRIATIPEHATSLWAEYQFQEGGLRGFGLGAGVRYIGASFNNYDNAIKVPSVTLADAAAHYDWNKVSVSINATNLLDKDYINACTATCYHGLRRTVFGTLKYRW